MKRELLNKINYWSKAKRDKSVIQHYQRDYLTIPESSFFPLLKVISFLEISNLLKQSWRTNVRPMFSSNRVLVRTITVVSYLCFSCNFSTTMNTMAKFAFMRTKVCYSPVRKFIFKFCWNYVKNHIHSLTFKNFRSRSIEEDKREHI